MTKFIRAFIILLVFINAIELSAQRIFPVQIRPSIRVGSVFLADYEDPSNFMVQVRLNDLNYPILHTRLKITIQKDDKIIKSKEGIPLDLIGGQTIILSSSDLKDLFDSKDLDLSNFSGSGNNVRTLPEGTYRFSFKATEVKSGQTVSDSTTDFTWATITVNDPPLLNLPGNLSEIEIRPGSQNIFFSWTPRGLPALPGTQFKYRMRMVQVDPPDRNPYEAMNTGVLAITDPIFENLDYTTFIYDQSLFNLQPGAVYAWQIEAYELINENGTMVPSSQRFRNKGFSEVYSFKVKENCPEVITENPITDTVSPGAPLIVLRWNRDPENHKAYEVKYRPAGTVLPWTIAQTLTNELRLGSLDLEKGKQYEYTVAAKCNSWQTAVYGGMFMIPASECEAPEPVEIVSNDTKGIKLSWDKVPSADSYSIQYKYSLSNDSTVTKNISEPGYLLPLVPAGFYTVQIDARCSGKTGEGKQLKINYKDTEIITDCPLPNPVRLTAQTTALSAGKKVDVTWNSLPVHAGYELKYHQRDSTTQYSYTSTTPGLKNIPAATGQIYQYQLTYTCKSGKTVTAPPGWFRAESEEDTVVRIKPGTASCFPPAFTMAEPKSKTSARIEWEKVKGADEYQVFYAPHGSTDFKLFTTTSSDARITELTATEKYDYKIKCRCGGEFSIFSKTGLLDMGISADGTCDSAKYFKVSKTTEKEIQLTWKYEPSHTGYKIQWKELSQPWDQKYTENLSNIDDLKATKITGDSVKYTIENLNAGTTYQFKLQVICQGKSAIIKGPLSGDTKSDKEDKKDCSSPNACDRSVTNPKKTLNVGDTVQVADYKMVISDIKSTGQDKWSGEADAEAPFIGLNEHIRLKTAFTDLVVNEKSCALSGKISIDSTTFQALADSTRNKIKKFVAQVDKYTDIAKSGLAAIDSAEKYGNTALNYYQGGGDQGKAKTGKLNPQITSNQLLTADKIKVGSGGEILIDGIGTGQQAPALIKDKEGQVFSVGKDNQPILAGKYDPTYQKLDSIDLNRKNYPVDFVANSKAKYAFDKFRKTYGERPAMSPHYLKRGDTFFSAKAIVPSEIDYVDFKIIAGDLNRSDLTFVNREGFVFAKDDNNTIIVVGGPSSDAQEVFAVTDKSGKREIVGALLLASYEPIVKKVVIIPVQLKDGLQKKISEITEQLNDVYGKVGITYTIEEDTSFRTNSDWCETPDCKFKPTGSALLSNNYTGDEKNVRDAYISFKGANNLDKDAAYIFAIGSPIENKRDEELQGKMRFEEQFGFLYNVSRMNEESLGKTLAHELGHGNYLLYHTFEKMYLGDDSKNTTFNVMDYGLKGDSLNKMQWDIVHQPGVNWGVFNRDGDQEMQHKEYKSISNLNAGEGSFMLSLSGVPLYLPASVKIVAAVSCGPILSFKNESDIYIPRFSQGTFNGYFGLKSNLEYPNTRIFQVKSDNVYTVRDYKSVNATSALPVVAQMSKDRFLNIDISGKNTNAISYCYSQTITTNQDAANRWNLVAVNQGNVVPYLNEFKQLPDNTYKSCAQNSSVSYKMEYYTMGEFADPEVELKMISFDGTAKSYYCIISKTYNQQKTEPSSPEVPAGKLSVNYKSKSYNKYEPIFIAESENTDASFQLEGMDKGTTVNWELIPGKNYTPGNDINTKTSSTNPFSIKTKIQNGTYILNSVAKTPNDTKLKDTYSTVVVSSGVGLTYLENKESMNSDTESNLPKLSEYTITIGAGDNIYIKFTTFMDNFYISPISDKDEKGNIARNPTEFTEVEFEKEYKSQIDGTLKYAKISELANGASGGFTLSNVGDANLTEVSEQIYFIRLIHKGTKIELASAKIKVKIIPKETLVKLTVEDGTSTKDCDCDKPTKGRFAENGKPLYIVVDPECDKSNNLDKTFNFTLTSTNNNMYKVPVKWNFEEEYFENDKPEKEYLKTRGIGIYPVSMNHSQIFKTRLSNISKTRFKPMNQFKLGGFELNVENIPIQLPNLKLITRATLFSQEKVGNIVFVQNTKQEIKFAFEDLKFKNEKSKKVYEFILKTKEISGHLNKTMKKLEEYRIVESKCVTEIPFWTGKLGYNKKELENSRLYAEVYNLDLDMVGFKYSCSRKYDYTNNIPILKAVKVGAAIFKGNLSAFVECSLGFETAITIKNTFLLPAGDELDGPNLLIEQAPEIKSKFELKGTLGVGLEAKLEDGFYCDGETSTSGSAKIDLPLIAELNVNPADFTYNMKTGIDDLKISFEAEVKICDIQAFKGEASFIIAKGITFEYPIQK